MAESRIIKRNVRFWGKSGLQLTGMMLIFMVVYGFLFNMGSSRVFGDFWKTAYFYGGIISVLFAMIGPVSYVGSYLPLTLSFGSGRMEAVFGAQIFCVVYVVSAYIILVFAGIMEQWKVQWKAECFDRSSVYIHDSDRAACLGCPDAFRNERNDYRNRHGGIRYSHRYCGRNWIY